MRTASVVLGVVVLVGGIVFFAMRSGSGAGEPRVAGPGGDAGGLPSDADVEALARLHEELARAVPVTGRSDEERLADARAWVAANRPGDWAYAELEAQMLAAYDSMADAEKRSARWVLDHARLEVAMIRALDADGDGRVSDGEVGAFAEYAVLLFDPDSHPYLLERFDPDGDGHTRLSDLSNMLADLNVLEGVVARVKADRWDTDGDGLLSEGESRAGREEALLHAKIFDDGHIEYVENPADDAAEANAAALAREVELFGEGVVEGTLARQDSAWPYHLSVSLTAAMRLEERGTIPELDPSLSPKSPEMSAFDLDGDGSVDEAQLGAYTGAWETFSQELVGRNALLEALRKRGEFERAVAQSDTDGDGRLLADEWERRIDRLLAERDERLFLRGYDLDGSGRVDAGELGTFVDWFRVGSLRADVNFDGAVDARDLQEMALKFQRQGG
jgi:Ca2+-binding EF-hand superfamily protein